MTTNTAPFSPAVLELVTGSHAQWLTLDYSTDRGATWHPLALVDGRLGWQERRTPRVLADVEVALDEDDPGDVGVYAALDPRAYILGRFTATYVLEDGTEDAHPVAVLQLRARGINHAGVVRLTFASKEAQYLDNTGTPLASGLVSSTPATFTADPAAWVASALTTGLAAGGPGDPPTVVNSCPVTSLACPDNQATMPPWDYWQQLADAGGFDIYDDGDQIMRVAPRVFTTNAGDCTDLSAIGAASVVLDTEVAASRDDFANWARVVYVYMTENTSGQLVRNVTGADAKLNTGPYSITSSGWRWLVDERDGRPSVAFMRAQVLELVKLMLSKVKTATVTAVPLWWLRPGDTVRLDGAGLGDYAIASSVEFSIGSAEMRVDVRFPYSDIAPTDYTLSNW